MSMYRTLFTSIALVVLMPTVVEAQENELTLGIGTAFSRASPGYGGLIDVQYGRGITESLWFVVRPELLLNLEAPDGQVMKQGALGLDVGLRWLFGDQEGVRIAVGASLGARGYFEPGYGGCIRLDSGIYFPLGSSMSVVLGGAVEGGVAELGDDYPVTEYQLRGDLWTRLVYRF